MTPTQPQDEEEERNVEPNYSDAQHRADHAAAQRLGRDDPSKCVHCIAAGQRLGLLDKDGRPTR